VKTPVLALLLLASLLAGCASETPPPAGTDPPPQQGTAGLQVLATAELTGQGTGFEPSVEAAPDGTIYVTAAQGVVVGDTRASRLWVSRDNGSSWTEVDPLSTDTGASNYPVGAEGDLAVAADGTVYYVDLTQLANVVLSRSTDQGRTWELRSPAVFAVPGGDREWVAAGPGQRVAVTWNQLAGAVSVGGQSAPGLWVAVSEDGGRTFPTQTLVPGSGVSFAGGIGMGPDGTILVARAPGDVTAWVSRDGGRTFSGSTVHATSNDTYLSPFADVDAAGNLYVSWIEQAGDGAVAHYAASADGRTWGRPVAISLGGSAMMPHIDAAEAGHIAMAYYCTDEARVPDEVDGAWHTCVADIRDAHTAQPAIVRRQVTQEPVKTGGICSGGLGCDSGRELGDYLQVAIGPGERLHVAWTTEDRQVHWAMLGPARLST
jgi:hypothetical protein